MKQRRVYFGHRLVGAEFYSAMAALAALTSGGAVLAKRWWCWLALPQQRFALLRPLEVGSYNVGRRWLTYRQ